MAKITKKQKELKSKVDVNKFSKKIFGGGGHKNAAGAVSKRSLDDTIYYFLDSLKNYKELLI